MDKIWILWWNYDDGSGQELVRAYEDETRTQEDFELAEHATDKNYMLDEIPYIRRSKSHE